MVTKTKVKKAPVPRSQAPSSGRRTPASSPDYDGYEEVGHTDLEVGQFVQGALISAKAVSSDLGVNKVFHVIAIDDKKRGTVTMTAGTILYSKLSAVGPSIGDKLIIHRVKDRPQKANRGMPAKDFRVAIKRVEPIGYNVPPCFCTGGEDGVVSEPDEAGNAQ